MKIIRKNHYTRSFNTVDMGISQTVPDQAMSMRTILQKYARGEDIGGAVYTPEYYDADGIDARRLDLAEIEEIKNSGRYADQQLKEEYEKGKIITPPLETEKDTKEKSISSSDGPEGQKTSGSPDAH